MTQLALVVEDARQRRWLENQLVKAAHYVLLSCDSGQLREAYGQVEEKPEIWVLLLPAHRVEKALDYIDSVSSAPTLVLEGWPASSAELLRWQGQLLEKLERSLAPPRSSPPVDAETIWLLGASLGGPEAVTAFFAALPPGLPAAFVYVQHIEEAFDRALVTQLNRNTHYRAGMFQEEAALRAGQVLIIAPEVKPRFLPFGRVIPSSRPWQGRYRPCIDEVAGDLALLYRERLGLIIFSGTYNDGEAAAYQVVGHGGRVWVQDPDSCLCATMPEAVIATGLVQVSGSPENLAATLAARSRRYTTQG